MDSTTDSSVIRACLLLLRESRRLLALAFALATAIACETAGVALARPVGTGEGETAEAIAARSVSLHESAHMHLVRSDGVDHLYEQGTGNGTFANCSIRLNMVITSTSEVSYEFFAYPSGGSISGKGRTHFYQRGATSYFTGALSVTHGSGRFAHVSSSLPITGAMNRRSYALELRVSGTLRY